MTAAEGAALLRGGCPAERNHLRFLGEPHRGLARRALPRRAGVARAGRPEAGAETFAGDDPLIADYLREEVLPIPAEELDFLMGTSVLDRLCGPLCDAVLDTFGSLDRLEASGARTASSWASIDGASGIATTSSFRTCCGRSSIDASRSARPSCTHEQACGSRNTVTSSRRSATPRRGRHRSRRCPPVVQRAAVSEQWPHDDGRRLARAVHGGRDRSASGDRAHQGLVVLDRRRL